MSKFQAIILGIFVIFIVAGVAAFATFKSSNTSSQLPAITIWGTFPQNAFDNYVAKINLTLASQLRITYVQKDQSEFSQAFIGALANGQGPDAILIPADMILPHLNKITPIPYTALPQRTFLNTYIQEGQIYLGQNGTYALPFAIDPLVMYWNRDMYSATGLATYPKYWEDFSVVNKKITTVDQNGNVGKTAIALGDFSNVLNAREILGSMLLQSGNTVTYGSGSSFQSALKQNPGTTLPAIQYFTNPVNPNDPNYSWNRGMPDSKTSFLSGTLATYFGFASELGDIQTKNPNLNFDVAPLPQFQNDILKSVYGKLYGLSIVRTSSNQNGVYQILSILTNPANIAMLSQAMYLPSVRRDLIAAGSTDPYITVFNQQALISRDWLDVDPTVSGNILGSMINTITSGAKSVQDAVSTASDQYDVALKQAVQ